MNTNAHLIAFLVVLCAYSLANPANAQPKVPDSVIWEEGIVYSSPGEESLALNLALPKALGQQKRPSEPTSFGER